VGGTGPGSCVLVGFVISGVLLRESLRGLYRMYYVEVNVLYSSVESVTKEGAICREQSAQPPPYLEKFHPCVVNKRTCLFRVSCSQEEQMPTFLS
jgi:hypothetical protein